MGGPVAPCLPFHGWLTQCVGLLPPLSWLAYSGSHRRLPVPPRSAFVVGYYVCRPPTTGSRATRSHLRQWVLRHRRGIRMIQLNNCGGLRWQFNGLGRPNGRGAKHNGDDRDLTFLCLVYRNQCNPHQLQQVFDEPGSLSFCGTYDGCADVCYAHLLLMSLYSPTVALPIHGTRHRQHARDPEVFPDDCCIVYPRRSVLEPSLHIFNVAFLQFMTNGISLWFSQRWLHLVRSVGVGSKKVVVNTFSIDSPGGSRCLVESVGVDSETEAVHASR